LFFFASLKPNAGIQVQSCIHIPDKRSASFEDNYQDLLNLDKIFNKEALANSINNQFKSQAKSLKEKNNNRKSNIPVFLYVSGKDFPSTGEKYPIC
jgi:ABC-type Fe3+-hydroxamate transport system substrate-binding protein